MSGEISITVPLAIIDLSGSYQPEIVISGTYDTDASDVNE